MAVRALVPALVVGLCGSLTASSAAAAPCESLTTLILPDTTVRSATAVPAGPFLPPGGAAPMTLRAFCRVVGQVQPAINFEVWLPSAGWNGRLQVVGNARLEGTINYVAMGASLTRGYAVASSDLGHVSQPRDGFDARWAAGRPDLVVDFGHRATHVTTVNAKEITRRFFERPADRTYFAGCSKGGQQGLMAAQRYPGDFDGILAGAPAHDWTRFYIGGHLWYATATLKDPESYIPASKLPLLDKAVASACDGLDGLVDGLLSDPRTCTFDPQRLACKPGEDNTSCLTTKQVKAVKDILGGARTSSGAMIFPGLMPGAVSAPNGWSIWVTGPAPFTSTHWIAADGFFKHIVFDDPKWDFRTFSFDRDVERALARVGGALDATDPNLRPFRALGSKLIVYHGWSDPDISPLSSISYFDEVVSVIGGHNRDDALRETQDFFRLFMVPGMGHCGGGPGPNSFDMVSALEAWVERGVAPASITAAHYTSGVADRTRPLCPYPQVARWNGVGSVDHAASFSCAAAPPPPRQVR
jgi:feruloyl esterase